MIVPVRRDRPTLYLLSKRREMLLVRIHAARDDTAVAGRRVAADLRAGERTHRSLFGGLKLVKATLVAGGVIWSLNSLGSSLHLGRGSRLFTIAMGLLSTMRAMRRIRAILLPPAPSIQHQG